MLFARVPAMILILASSGCCGSVDPPHPIRVDARHEGPPCEQFRIQIDGAPAPEGSEIVLMVELEDGGVFTYSCRVNALGIPVRQGKAIVPPRNLCGVNVRRNGEERSGRTYFQRSVPLLRPAAEEQEYSGTFVFENCELRLSTRAR